jgi:hypothetical protein
VNRRVNFVKIVTWVSQWTNLGNSAWCARAEGVMGAAAALLWDLADEGGPQRLQELLPFLEAD